MPETLVTPRAITSGVLPGLLAVQRACYGAQFLESAEVHARRIAHPGQFSFVISAAAGHSGPLLAYLMAYAGTLGQVTALNGDFDTTPQPDTLVLHDLAVLPHCTGQNWAQSLLQHCWKAAMRMVL